MKCKKRGPLFLEALNTNLTSFFNYFPIYLLTLDKIFFPTHFKRKPTSRGTGLGLSLSYDIVKAHGGEIKVETSEAEGTEFIITIPVKS